MRNWLRKLTVTVLSVLLAGASVVSISNSAEALKGSDFDPGLIISDSVFFDFGTMNAASVQRFLENQVSKCTDNDGGPKCLRNYTEDIVGSVAIKDLLKSTYQYGMCKTVDPAKDQKASQIIVTVARACGINPRVLLVMLQKEQGLVQSPDPTDYMYKAAMGYGCPDSHPEICGKDAVAGSRLFAQLYRAAWQLQWYGDSRGSFTWLKPGRKVHVLYSPKGKTACGDRYFLMQSQATANLYYYTPYTPNSAALKNLYGTGDGCSAYGNRNFWRFFWSWFGSPVAGGFLLKSETSDYYLVVDFNKNGRTFKYKYKLTDPGLLDAYQPLGPLGIISQSYLDSFPDGGSLSRIVKSNGLYFFVDAGFKYQFSNCDQATAFGYDCTTAVELTDIQAAALQTGEKMASWVREDPADATSALYLVQGATKRAVLNNEAIVAANLTPPARIAPVSINKFSNLPWGNPIAPENILFTNTTTKQQGFINAGRYFEISAATAVDVDFSTWFDKSSNGIRGDALAPIDSKVLIRSIVQDVDHKTYILTAAGKREVSNPSDLGVTPPTLDAALLGRIPDVANDLATPAFVRVSGSRSIFWLDNGKRRLTDTSTTRVKLLPVAAEESIQSIPPSALNMIPAGGPVFTPGQLIKDAKGRLYLADGTSNLVSVPSAQQASLFGLGRAVVKKAKGDLASYTKIGRLSGLKVKCGDQIYLPVASTLQPIAADYAKHYPGATQVLGDLTCQNLKLGTKQLGRFVQSPANLIYLMQDGKRRLIDTSKNKIQYNKLRGETPVAFKVDLTAATLLPVGKPVSTKTVTPIAVAGQQPSPSPTPTPTATKTATPTPTPTPTPTVKPAARPNPCTPTSYAYLNRAKTNWYHKVTSGESLNLIASKCGTTTANLKTWNSISNANLITVGQAIRVSNY